MNTSYLLLRSPLASWVAVLACLAAAAPIVLAAPPKAPEGKIYVVSAEGSSQVASAGKIVTPAPKMVFLAQGAQLTTKPAGNLTVVLSNGTGAFLASDTQIEVKRFTQEPFKASRTDLEREPSVSHTEINVDHGILAVSTSKLAAGSTMTILTPLGTFNLRDGNLVIQVDGGTVTFFLLVGEGTVHGGSLDLGGQVLHAGEQAVIVAGPPGQPNDVKISKILPNSLPALEEMAARAYAARKTVFFESEEDDIVPVIVVPAVLPPDVIVSPSRLPN